jgi:superfamily II DNA or RNA helicase
MTDLWKVLGKKELQGRIGAATLERLEKLVPVLLPENADPEAIYLMETLCSLFDAFSGPEAILDKEFRRTLYNHLPADLMDQVISSTGVARPEHSFEEKVDKLVAKGWKDRAFCEAVSRILGLPDTFLPVERPAEPLDEIFPAAVNPLKPLKDYQFGVYQKAIEATTPNNGRFVVQMPTGSGKTRTAMELIATLLNAGSEGTAIVWLAHSEELCEQAYECFRDVWCHVGHHDIRIIRCWGPGAELPYTFAERAFLVCGFQKLHSLLSKNRVPFVELSRKVLLVVVDEAHKVLAPTYNETTRALLGDGTRVMGLTATPGRSANDAEENKALADFFFRKIVAIDSGEKPVIPYLRRLGVLSEVKYQPIITELRYELTASQREHLENYFDLPPGILRTIGSDDIRNLEILRTLFRECDSGRRIIFFACSVEHSKFICANLVFLGVKAAHVDGSTSRVRRHVIVDDFRAGRLQVICNFGVLSTGFDAPKTDVVFIARPTASIVLYSQMIGRGLRGPAIGGTAECKVIDVKDNIEGFSDQNRVYEYFNDYFQPER